MIADCCKGMLTLKREAKDEFLRFSYKGEGEEYTLIRPCWFNQCTRYEKYLRYILYKKIVKKECSNNLEFVKIIKKILIIDGCKSSFVVLSIKLINKRKGGL